MTLIHSATRVSAHAADRTAVTMGFELEDQGFHIARGIVPQALIERIGAELADDFRNTPFCVGEFYGERTKRFGRLLARSRSVAELVLHPLVLQMTDRLLRPWCDTVQLNVTQAIEIHPHALAQFPHRDQDMWGGPKGVHEYLINVMWPLTPFTAANGATLLWPDSHGRAGDDDAPVRDMVCAEALPGDAILFLGSTLHGAGANFSTAPRRGLVIGYSLGWLKPYENLWLAYPPHVARNFSPELATLAGYTQHRPNLGNYEGQCPSILLGRGEPTDDPGGDRSCRRLAAIDAVRPDQAVALAAHADAERAARAAGRSGGGAP